MDDDVARSAAADDVMLARSAVGDEFMFRITRTADAAKTLEALDRDVRAGQTPFTEFDTVSGGKLKFVQMVKDQLPSSVTPDGSNFLVPREAWDEVEQAWEAAKLVFNDLAAAQKKVDAAIAKHGMPTGKEVKPVADEVLAGIVRKLEAAEKRKREAENDVALCQLRLKRAIVNAKAGVEVQTPQDGTIATFTWRPQIAKRFNATEAKAFLTAEQVDACTYEVETHVFRGKFE